ncbi:MAG: hypothetical protein AAGF73_04340 [Actinomycetota bacterium]
MRWFVGEGSSDDGCGDEEKPDFAVHACGRMRIVGVMTEHHIKPLIERLATDDSLRDTLRAAPATEHRTILTDAEAEHHEQLNDEQLAAVLDGVAGGLSTNEVIGALHSVAPVIPVVSDTTLNKIADWS